MENQQFALWCQMATREIRYMPDRKMVYRELLAHLEDHRDAYIAEGMAVEAATEKALAAMGAAEEIAPTLGRIHRPFWGYVYSISKIAAILLCIIALQITLIPMLTTLPYFIRTNDDSYELTAPDMDTYCKADQGVSDFSDGFLFQVPASLFWQSGKELNLKFHLQVLNCSFLSRNNNFVDYIWAVDNLGNYYESRAQGMYTEKPRLINNQCNAVGYLDVYTMTIVGIPTADIQWMELHYDRDGRDVVLRIDLSGGVGA